jgi:hypothetical protein
LNLDSAQKFNPRGLNLLHNRTGISGTQYLILYFLPGTRF